MDCSVFLLLFILGTFCYAHQGDLHLTILHTNSVTSSFEQFDSSGDDCSPEEDLMGVCFGGVARRGTVIQNTRNERDDINVLLLDAGDQFVGEWFDFFRGEATSYFMNKLGYDSMTFGNLEFALGPDALASFLTDVDFDVVSSNLNVTLEPVLQGLFNKSVVKMIDEQSVGIIGYSVQRVNEIAQVRRAFFEDVIEAVQAEVDTLTSQGVNKIIVLGHSWGDLVQDSEVFEIAQNISGVDIMVLGGLNIFQYKGCSPSEQDVPGGFTTEEYPIVVTPNDDPYGNVLIIHGYPNAKSIGRLNVIFNDQGKVSEWYGGPIRLDNNIKQDPDLLTEIMTFAERISNVTDRLIGSTNVFLQGSPRGVALCRRMECNMGNLITDAMIWKYVTSFDEEKWNDVSIAVMNGGGIRASIERGEIRFSDIKEVLPFSNTFDAVELEGKYIKEMLEHSVSSHETSAGRFLQVSGMEVTYDLSMNPYEGRVSEVLVRCSDCSIPQLVPLEDDRVYRFVVPSFIASGGDGYAVIRDRGMNYVPGEPGENVLAEYIKNFSPVFTGIEGRIKFIETTLAMSTPTPV